MVNQAPFSQISTAESSLFPQQRLASRSGCKRWAPIRPGTSPRPPCSHFACTSYRNHNTVDSYPFVTPFPAHHHPHFLPTPEPPSNQPRPAHPTNQSSNPLIDRRIVWRKDLAFPPSRKDSSPERNISLAPNHLICYALSLLRGCSSMDRALDYGSRCCRFKSCQPRHNSLYCGVEQSGSSSGS